MRRKEQIAGENVYHIFNKSIAEFKIFNGKNDFVRIKNLLRYYQVENMLLKFWIRKLVWIMMQFFQRQIN